MSRLLRTGLSKDERLCSWFDKLTTSVDIQARAHSNMAEPNHPHAADPAGGPTDNVDVHHEESDVNIRAIFGFGGALVAVALVVFLLVYVLFNFFTRRAGESVPAEYPLAAAQGDRLPPEPRLQEHPREDLAALREREEQILTTYGVVDQNAGVYRIPIEQAMKLVLERGLPARQEQTR